MAGSDSTLTLRGVSAKTRGRLKRQAVREKCSGNALVVRLIEAHAGTLQPALAPQLRDLTRFAGRWRAAEAKAKALERATTPFNAIDPSLWK